MRRATIMAIGVIVATGCESAATSKQSEPLEGPEAGVCPSATFLYEDESCPGVTDAGSSLQCTQEGDGLCHERCNTDADCSDPGRPYCRILGLFDGGDWNCNAGVRVCRETDKDDCFRNAPRASVSLQHLQALAREPTIGEFVRMKIETPSLMRGCTSIRSRALTRAAEICTDFERVHD
jgi:hypothetical protein